LKASKPKVKLSRELKRALDEDVKRLAAKYCFNDVRRFRKYYVEMYGEEPRETLLRGLLNTMKEDGPVQ
jgi:hypothetical protein